MIRLAKFDDYPALQQLITLAVQRLSTDYYTTRQIESSLKYIFGIDSQLITDGTYYVAEQDNIIVGCGGWSRRQTLFGGDQHKSIEDPLLDPMRDAARIRAFFVHPGYTRQGIGRQIIQVCEEVARAEGFRMIELGATLPGVPLYKAMGYRAIEDIDVPMPDGELLEIVKMSKAL